LLVLVQARQSGHFLADQALGVAGLKAGRAPNRGFLRLRFRKEPNMSLDHDHWSDAGIEQLETGQDGLERSLSPEAPMNLLLRFETASGPRTVIACSVPRQVAAEIAEVMRKHGQDAQFIDRCAPLSVADRVMIKNLH
jgi:hypothetical protein